MGVATIMGCIDSTRLLGTDDVYMPITPMFHVHAWGIPYAATMLGLKQVYPGRYEPELLVELWRREKVTFSHCVPTILQMLLNAKSAQTSISAAGRSSLAAAPDSQPVPGRQIPWHPAYCRLRHV